MDLDSSGFDPVADRLVAIYEKPFGGRAEGRYRIVEKLLRSLCGRQRLYEADIHYLIRAMLERDYVLIEMDGFSW